MTTLYRLFDIDDVLLYVGIAGNPGRRFEEHSKTKPWWSLVDHVDLEHYDTRWEAAAAERHAIETEAPLHNIVYNLRSASETEATEETIVFECEECGDPITGAGWLDTDNVELARCQAELATWNERRDSTISALLDRPRSIPWRAWHMLCAPDGDREHYSIPLDRLRTRAHLLWWTSQLMGFAWFSSTNWRAILDRYATSPVQPERDASHG